MRFLAVLAVLLATLDAQQVSTELRQKDLSFIADQLPKLHINFYARITQQAFQQAADDLNSRAATATDAEFYVGLSQLIALAGDAHTSIALNGAAAESIGFRTLPLVLRWLDDGVFVTGATSAFSRAVGTQLVAIGSIPIDEVMRRMTTVIPHGNDQWVRYMSQQYLTGQQILQGLHVLTAGAPSTFTFRTLAGEEFSLQLSPGTGPLITVPDSSSGMLPDYLLKPGSKYWFSYSAPNRLLHFKYNQCSNDPGLAFATFAASVLDTLDKNPVDTFVFDLRGNTGGNSSLWDPLIEGLAQRVAQIAANPQFRIYAIVDKGTFSSGMDDAMSLKQPLPAELGALLPGVDLSHLTVQVVGEASGGKPAEYGEVQPFTLPGSKLAGQYSTKYFPNPSYIPDLPSFLPDIPTPIRSTDYFARHDPAIAAILVRSKGAPAPPSGDAIVVNGASFRIDQGVAPGSLATVFGNFTKAPDQVLVGGAAATVISGNASQANFVVPLEVAPGVRTVSVRASGREVAGGTVTISPAGPGIFVMNAADGSQPGAVENQDYSVNTAANPAAPGSVLQIFATGSSPADSTMRAQVFIGNVPAEVQYSGPSGYPGLWQINAKVPAGTSGQTPVFIAAQGFSSNAVTVWIH